jgi:oligopeptide transport system substrate-binding protein
MRRVSVALACLGLVLLAACARRQSPAEAARNSGTLLLGNGAEPQDLDPQICTAYTDYNVLIALFEGLTCIDEATSQPVPGMAESWDVSPDGLSYTFHLRPGIAWSNGDPVTAEDFVYSFQRILSPALAAEYSYFFYPLVNAEAYNAGKITDFSAVGVKAADARTLRVTLAAPCPYLPALAANQAWFPVHRATIEKFGARDRRGTRWTRPENIVTNGPFLLKEWSPNSRIVVIKNPRYWDAGRNRLNAVVFYPNEAIAVDESNFRAGQLHVTYDLLPERIEHYRRDEPAVLRVDLLSESDFLRFNVTKPPLNDPRVRQALSRAIDRVALARQVLYGSREPAFALTPPNTAGYTPAAGAPTDVAAARRLLAEAGYPGGRGFPRLEVQMWTDPVNSKILEAIQQMWHRDLGIEVALVNQDFRVYLDNQRTLAYRISRSRWLGDYLDPSTYLDLFKTAGGNNQTGWSSPAYDRLNDEAGRTLDPGRRRQLLQQAEAILLGEAPIAPLFYGTRTFLIQPYVQGWVPSLLGIHRYQYVWLEK